MVPLPLKPILPKIHLPQRLQHPPRREQSSSCELEFESFLVASLGFRVSPSPKPKSNSSGFSRVEVEMGRSGFYLGKTPRPGPRDPRQETSFDSQLRIKSRTLERILSFAASQSKSINIFGIGIISASTKYDRLLKARAGFACGYFS